MTKPMIGINYLFIDHEGKPDYLTVADITDEHVWYKIESYRNPLPMARSLWDNENYPAAETVAAALTDLLMADDQTPLDELLRQAVQTLMETKCNPL